ncbi:hypothetical protein [Dyadobacter diqingensis]|uniref:hypothetical protein n=1 Tax=Dyadobacter diqingensis TaxID=2938121 RepID=UPI0020C3BEE6|nr:hypothetical protein [Dyadobacter diqingensis]
MGNSAKISRYFPALIWLLHSSLVVMLVCINPNHYTTTDSHYYLESAHNILSGNGYSVFQNKQHIWNSTFPPAYPLAIVMVSFLTQTNVLIASKLVNIISLATWIICLKRWFGNIRTTLLASTLLTGSFLKLWSHSWSEPLFIITLFCWTYHFCQLYTGENLSKSRVFKIFSLGLLLIFTRYAGIFIVPFTFLYGLICFLKKEKSRALTFAALASGWAGFFAGYLWINMKLSGEWFGGERFGTTINFTENLIVFVKGLLNELLMIRDTNFLSIDMLFLSGLIIQGLLFIFIIKQVIRHRTYPKQPASITSHFLIIGITYLFFLFTVRIFSPFDEPGYRLLAPFSFLILNGLLLSIRTEKMTSLLKYLLAVLIIFSWVDLLPHRDFKIEILKQSFTIKICRF